MSIREEYAANYDRIAADHLDHYRETGFNLFIPEGEWQSLEAATARFIKEYAPEGPILDAGVGMGRLLSRFPERERHGVDIASGYLDAAREAGIQTQRAWIEELPYEDETFAAVVCTDVLEHVLDLNRCVTELLRVLRPGGYLFVRTPNAEDLSSYLTCPYRFVHLRRFDDPTHRLLFERIFGCEVVLTEPVEKEINVVVHKPETKPD